VGLHNILQRKTKPRPQAF